MKRTRRVAIIGAGPIGLEAALFASQSGYKVAVFERGSLAQNVQDWGRVRLFSPFGLNASAWGIDALTQSLCLLPGDEELLTGREFARRYLVPLGDLPEIAQNLRCQTEVLAIGRAKQLKQDHIGVPARGETPFRLLVADEQGERIEFADYVLDCSGTYPHHNWAGSGGLPCPGERELLQAANYQLPDILGQDKARFANRSVLVIGGGYSAATAIVALAKLAKSAPETMAIWLTRHPRELPISPIEQDSLPERERLTNEANRWAITQDGPIDWQPGCEIFALAKTESGQYQVVMENVSGNKESLVVDEVLAQVGYRPDRNLYEELQIHECYASHGPMKLAAALLGETSVDCLAQTSHGGETLKNPEPGFFILGSKSYGRGSKFLLKIGIAQIREVFSLIAQEQLAATS